MQWRSRRILCGPATVLASRSRQDKLPRRQRILPCLRTGACSAASTSLTRRSALGMESYFNIESTEGQTSRGGPARTTQSWLFHGSAEGYLAVQELGFALAALSRSQALSHHGNGAERVWGLENGMMLITRKGILLD
ncbi:hypothetical protein CIHG_00032 [Coccidioides immitis H538.4]|uniref:Uncharacterized protein n=1 Tax=Coccidioides immitis H538.4 TaxID=396776 RepID=A0A0J8RCK4_COCIT|nr:hypothetical protein CIHG_00032 [Coccidioides immitis H538.4]